MICQIISRLRESLNIISFRPSTSLPVIFQYILVSRAFYILHTNFDIMSQMWELPDPPEEPLRGSGHWWGFSAFLSVSWMSLSVVVKEKKKINTMKDIERLIRNSSYSPFKLECYLNLKRTNQIKLLVGCCIIKIYSWGN